MKIRNVILTAFFAFIFSGFITAQTWSFDKGHSQLTFEVSHMVISTVHGIFKDFDVKLEMSGDDWSKASVTGTAKVASIFTDNEKRDGHLQSADFFDAGSNPEIKFVSKSFEKSTENVYTVTGDLTMRGVTKEVSWTAKYKGNAKDPWGNHRYAWSATVVVNRFDFGLEWNAAIEAGGLVAGEEIEITVDAEFIKK